MDSNVILLGFMAIMVAMMFMSSRKRKQQAQQLQDSLKVGARVVLHSGVVGTVESIASESIIVKSAGSTIEVLRPAVRSIDPVLASDSAVDARTAATAKPVAAKSTAKPATSTAKKPVAKPAAKPAAAKTSTAKKPAAK